MPRKSFVDTVVDSLVFERTYEYAVALRRSFFARKDGIERSVFIHVCAGNNQFSAIVFYDAIEKLRQDDVVRHESVGMMPFLQLMRERGARSRKQKFKLKLLQAA